MVEQARQYLPLFAHLHIYAPQAVDDPILTIQQNQVGIPAHALQHQPPLSPLPQLVRDVYRQRHRPLQARLVDTRQPSAL